MGTVQVWIRNPCQNWSQQPLPYFSARWRMSPFGCRDLSSFWHGCTCTDTDWLSVNSIDRFAQVTLLQHGPSSSCSATGTWHFPLLPLMLFLLFQSPCSCFCSCFALPEGFSSSLALGAGAFLSVKGLWPRFLCSPHWPVLSKGEELGLCYWFGLLCLWESRFWWLMPVHCTRAASNFSLIHGCRNTARWYFFPGKWSLFYGKWECFVGCKRP